MLTIWIRSLSFRIIQIHIIYPSLGVGGWDPRKNGPNCTRNQKFPEFFSRKTAIKKKNVFYYTIFSIIKIMFLYIYPVREMRETLHVS